MRPRSITTSKRSRERGRSGGAGRRILLFVVTFALAFFVVNALFLQSVRTGSASMLPTLEPGDRLLVSPLLYGPRIRLFNWTLPGITPPSRGDLVAVRPAFMPDAGFFERLANPLVRLFSLQRVRLDDGETWRGAVELKRIIGLPGDTIRMERFTVFVRPAGETQFSSEFELSSREYETLTGPLPDGWRGNDPFGGSMKEMTLEAGEYFVMGDNRVAALDSRHWGSLDEASLRGRVFLRYWPLGRAGTP